MSKSKDNLTNHTPSKSESKGPTSRSEESLPTTPQPSLEEQISKIIESKTHYETLGVPTNATAGEIKKAYRRAALKVHPDKCKKPGADDAFKKIGKAFAVLSDDQSRRNYDTYGDSPNNSGGQSNPFDGLSAEELFNLYFNEVDPNDLEFHEKCRDEMAESKWEKSTYGMIRLAIIVLVLVIYLFSNSSEVFSYTPSDNFPITKYTKDHHTTFYVTDEYESITNQAKDRIELQVEQRNIKNLWFQCQKQQSSQMQLERHTASLSKPLMFETSTDACKELRRIYY